MKPVKGAAPVLSPESAKARREQREEGQLKTALFLMERRNPSVTELCPDCGRHTCWLGAWVLTAGGDRVRARPIAITDGELLRRAHARSLYPALALLAASGSPYMR